MEGLPTSPTLNTNSDLMNDAKTFSGNLTLDLTDEQIQASWRIIQRIRRKHQDIFRQKFNDSSFTMNALEKAIDEFSDEITYELADKVGVLAKVDVTPLLLGEPMIIEWLGVLPGQDLGKFGMDHEKKEWEVKRATAKGEAFLGEYDG